MGLAMSSTLPPLPLRFDVVTRANPDTGGYHSVAVFSGANMRAYGEACAAAEREACAEVCDSLLDASDIEWPSTEWVRRCAAAIRARGET